LLPTFDGFLFINGEKLNIADPMTVSTRYEYSLKRRTRNGINTFKIENILPKGASLNIQIPYPHLDNHEDKQSKQVAKLNFSKVDQLINQDIEQGFPGAVLLVMKDGQVIKHDAYGFARKFSDGGQLMETPIPMKQDTLFDIASNTKMFATNLALMKLVSEGKLDVTQPISLYLPDYRGDGRETRLVKDFLGHQAGYGSQVMFYSKDNALGEQYYSQHKSKTEQLILSQVPFSYARQSKRIYSDTDFMLLGMLIERITGQTLDAYVEHSIYQPLHLSNTLFNPLQKGKHKQQFAATEIHGTSRGGRISFDNMRDYVLQGEVHDDKAYHSFAGVAGHAGLFSTTSDMAVLMQMLLNGGGYEKNQFFDQNVLEQFIKPEEGDGSYGLGWRRNNNGALKWHFGPYASAQAYGHTGWTGTVTVIDPKYDLAIVLLTNARHSKIDGDDKEFVFKGKQFETGQYGSIISLIYEAILNQKSMVKTLGR
jgi:CubicO group peptidase (beta-lactamase class C family)